MKKVILLFIITTTVSCSSLKIEYDYDLTINFSNYKTYAFSDDALNLPIDKTRLEKFLNSIDDEMADIGFHKSDKPDIIIDLHLKKEKKTDSASTTVNEAPWKYGYGSGFPASHTKYADYTEGTLFINIIDKSNEKIIWQGRANRKDNMETDAAGKEIDIKKATKNLLLMFPPKSDIKVSN